MQLSLCPRSDAYGPLTGSEFDRPFLTLHTASDPTPLRLPSDLQSVVVVLASLGCSRRDPQAEGSNIIALQRRRSYQFHLRWGAISHPAQAAKLV